MNTKAKAILDWAASEKLNNDICGYTEEFYSGLITVLSEQFSINRDELTSYLEEEYDSLEAKWASETDVDY